MPWKQYWPVADGHADTLVAATGESRSFFQESAHGHMDLVRLRRAGVDLQVLAICAEERGSSYAWAVGLLEEFARKYREHTEDCVWLREAEDWRLWENSRKTGVLLALEGLEPLEGEVKRLEEFYALGIRMVSLTWNHANPFAAGVLANGGLTRKGRMALACLTDLGMALDLSHLHQEGFWEIIRAQPPGPVLATHANAAALMFHPRNLTDDQIKAPADLGGTVGVAMYPPFLTEETANVRHALKHIEHIMEVGGMGCPAFGCDFDGIKETPRGITDVTDFPEVFAAMEEEGWAPEVIQGIIGANLVAVLRRTAELD